MSGRYRCISCRERWTEGGLQCDVCLGHAPETAVRAEVPAVTHSADPRDAGVVEATRQHTLVELLELAGWTVYRIGQRNAHGTQDPGPSDLYCVHEARRLVCWIEVKRPEGGRPSDAQREFRRLMDVVGVPCRLASEIEDVATLHRTLPSLRPTPEEAAMR